MGVLQSTRTKIARTLGKHSTPGTYWGDLVHIQNPSLHLKAELKHSLLVRPGQSWGIFMIVDLEAQIQWALLLTNIMKRDEK